MEYEPYNDTFLEEDEDIKIWRGDTDDAKRRESRRRETAENTGKHSKKPSPGRGEKKQKTPSARRKIRVKSVDKKELIIMAAAAVLIIAAGFVPLDGWKKALVCLVPFAAAGYGIMGECVKDILNLKLKEQEIVVTFAAIAAFIAGAYTGAAVVFLVFRLGKAVEAFALERRDSALGDIRNVSAGRARVETADGILTVGPEYVNEGDIIFVAPNQQIPLDGVVEEGISAIDLSPLTGAQENRAVNVGHKVFAGAINVTAPLKIRVTNTYEDSSSCRAASLVEDAAETPAPEETLTRQAAKYIKPLMLIAALLTAVVPPVMTDGDWRAWLCRAAALAVLSNVAPAVVSVPLAYFGALVSAGKKGIIIKGSNITSLLAKPDTFVFDKTGTVTEGRYRVSEVFPVDMTEDELLSLAATAESCSSHAIAAAIKAVGAVIDAEVLTAEELPGRGISAFIDGRHIYVGNALLLEEHGIKYAVPSRPGAAGHVALDGKYCGHILVTDKVRNGAFESIDSLRTCGAKKMVMLTGDVLSVARPIANKLNFDMLKAEIMPEEKAAAVAYLTDNCPINRALIFVGDGDSDADALKNADIGIALETLGREETIDNADVAVFDGEIRKLPAVVRLAQKTRLIVQENLFAVLGVKAVLIFLTLLGAAPLAAVAITDGLLHAGAIANAFRTFCEITIIPKKER